MAFYRLIGSAYFKKHRSAFQHTSPAQLFMSLAGKDSSHTQHMHFLDLIRDTIWAKVPFEDEMPPLLGALNLHWARSSWVLNLWSQADKQTVVVKDVCNSGWKVDSDSGLLKVVWEMAEHVVSIQERVAMLTRGCGCKTGCRTKRCKCAKMGQYCGPGCKCNQCRNLESRSAVSDSEDELQLEEEVEETRARSSLERTLVTFEEDGDSTICEDSDPDIQIESDEDAVHRPESDSSTC